MRNYYKPFPFAESELYSPKPKRGSTWIIWLVLGLLILFVASMPFINNYIYSL